MDRLLRSAGGTLTLLNYNEATGALADAGAGNAVVNVFDSAGVNVEGPIVGTNGPTGTYVATIGATFDPLESLDVFDVVWDMPDGSDRRTQFETVGAFLFTVAALKAFNPNLTSKTAPQCVEARNIVEDAFSDEEVTISAFRPQGRRERHSGDGTDALFLERMDVNRVTSVKVDGTALTSGELAELIIEHDEGQVLQPAGAFWPDTEHENVEILYEYGDRHVNGEVRRAAMQFASFILTKFAIDANDRATVMFTGEGEGFRLSIAGRDGVFGLPELDAVLARKGRTVPGIA